MKTSITKKALSELSSDNPQTKYRRVKLLILAAQKDPRRLASHVPFFVTLLESENNILRWTAIDIIGHLANVVKKTRLEQFVKLLVEFLRGGKLIAANHAIAALSQIAIARPEYQERIVQELLGVEHYMYETEECRNIALGKVLVVLGSHIRKLTQRHEVLAFVQRQLENGRPATRKKAQKLLKQMKRPT